MNYGENYINLICYCLFFIFYLRAFGDGACKGVTVGDCQLLDEYVIETLSIGISADLCQDICQQKTNCVVFQHSAENCTLLTEDYRQDCGTSGGPTVSNMGKMLCQTIYTKGKPPKLYVTEGLVNRLPYFLK